jgi:hypothetical protein
MLFDLQEFDADYIMALNSNNPMTIEIINGVISVSFLSLQVK